MVEVWALLNPCTKIGASHVRTGTLKGWILPHAVHRFLMTLKGYSYRNAESPSRMIYKGRGLVSHMGCPGVYKRHLSVVC